MRCQWGKNNREGQCTRQAMPGKIYCVGHVQSGPPKGQANIEPLKLKLKKNDKARTR